MSSAKVGLITGAARGLGREMALAFARAGYRVAACDVRDCGALARRIQKEAGEVATFPVDVTRSREVEAVVRRVLSRWGRIDLLITSAGIEGPTGPLQHVSPSQWERTLKVNLTGTFLCDRAVIPHMLAQGGGGIIHMASVAGVQAYPLRAPYAAAKWAVIGLTQTLAAELGPFGIRVNAICPGPVRGPRMARVIRSRARELGKDPREVQGEYAAATLLGRLVEPREVVELALYLASDRAGSITGQAVRVCGGYRL